MSLRSDEPPPKHDRRDVALIGLDLLACVVSHVTRFSGHSRVAQSLEPVTPGS